MTSRLHSMYLKTVIELDDNSQIAEQPECTLGKGIRLKKHQLALLHKCRQFELHGIQVISNDSTDDSYIQTKMGIIGDIVGSGKSYVVLSLIASDIQNDQLIDNGCSVYSICDDRIVVSKKIVHSVINTNFIVVPPGLCHQWEYYINAFMPDDTKYIILTNKSKLKQFINQINQYSICVMTACFYKHVVDYIRNTKSDHIVIRRLIFDEADVIRSVTMVPNMFCWFVTASIANMIMPYGRHSGIMSERVSGIVQSGFIKTAMYQLSRHPTLNASTIIVRCNPNFVKQSYQLPEIVHNIVECASPECVRVLNGLVDKKVMECLNGNDIDAAIVHSGVHRVSSETNIINLLISKMCIQLANLENELKFKESDNVTYTSDQERTSEINRITLSKNAVEKKISNIKERIKECDICSICYDSLKNKTVVSCCSNSFCFKCINLWLMREKTSSRNACPMCNQHLDKTMLLTIDQRDSGVSHSNSVIHPSNSKVQNLSAIVKSLGPDSKVLICSSVNSWNSCNLNGVKARMLKGTKLQIESMIDEYKNKDVNVLLMNPEHYGCGLNLENTTDVVILHTMDQNTEQQVVGRAQRCGRTRPLTVWYLCHANEMESRKDGMVTNSFTSRSGASEVASTNQAIISSYTPNLYNIDTIRIPIVLDTTVREMLQSR